MSTGFGTTQIGATGRGMGACVNPATARWKAGGVTIDWSTVSRGVNAQGTIVINATGGTFTATFGGQTTGALAWNITPALFEDALQQLSSIGNGNIFIGGVAGNYTYQFEEGMRWTPEGAITTNAGSLTGGAGTATVTQTIAGVSDADVTLVDGQVVKKGVKYIPVGTILSKITATGKYGPADTSQADGRQIVDKTMRGRSFILDRTITDAEIHSDLIGQVFDAGIAFRARLQVDGVNQPTTSNLLDMMPGLTLAE